MVRFGYVIEFLTVTLKVVRKLMQVQKKNAL